MATNFPGPYECRLNYAAVSGGLTLAHQHRFSLEMDAAGAPGDPFSSFFPLGRLTAFTETLEDYVDDYVALIQPFFATTTDLNDVELWEYEPGTFNAAFRSVLTLGLNGVSGSPSAQDAQTIITFRGTLGGPIRMDFRNPIYSQSVFETFPTSVSAVNDYAAFIVGNNTPIRARDGGFAFAPLKLLPGVNERMTRKRLR